MKALEILPAIDVKEGVAIRLVKGELDNQSKYGNPLEIANEFIRSGVNWIHLVDLDTAFGLGENSELLASIIKTVNVKVQLSGGIKDEQSLNQVNLKLGTKVKVKRKKKVKKWKCLMKKK